MSDLAPDAQIRAYAVIAAAALLGPQGHGIMRGAYSSRLYADDDMKEVTSQIGMYIKHGSWEIEDIV